MEPPGDAMSSNKAEKPSLDGSGSGSVGVGGTSGLGVGGSTGVGGTTGMPAHSEEQVQPSSRFITSSCLPSQWAQAGPCTISLDDNLNVRVTSSLAIAAQYGLCAFTVFPRLAAACSRMGSSSAGRCAGAPGRTVARGSPRRARVHAAKEREMASKLGVKRVGRSSGIG